MNTDPVAPTPMVLEGPAERRLVAGRHAYFAPGVPLLEPDALTYDVPADPSLGETGAIEFARETARWLARLFDQPVQRITYRESRWDHRPCPRVVLTEIALTGHEVTVLAYDSRHHGLIQYALTVDGRPVPFVVSRSMRNLPWRLAAAAWRATLTQLADRHP